MGWCKLKLFGVQKNRFFVCVVVVVAVLVVVVAMTSKLLPVAVMVVHLLAVN